MVCTVYVGDNLAIDITGGWTISPTVMGSTETLITITYNGVSTTQRMTLPTYYPVLENNSWATIAAAAQEGIASSTWSIGDTKTLTIDGKTYTAKIVGFNHYTLDRRDPKYGSVYNGRKNKAAIAFMITTQLGSAKLLYDSSVYDLSAGRGSGSYEELIMHRTTLPAIAKKMEAGVSSNLRTCVTDAGCASPESFSESSPVFQLILPSIVELTNISLDNDGDVLPYFDNTNPLPFAPMWTRTNNIDSLYEDGDNAWLYISNTNGAYVSGWGSSGGARPYTAIFCI